MKFLFVMERINWPRISGPDVHGSQMIRALIQKGHQVALATEGVLHEALKCELGIQHVFSYGSEEVAAFPLGGSWLQNKFKDYWGVSDQTLLAIRKIAENFKADVIVSTGLGGLPFMLATQNTKHIWYAADEWFLHHLSLIKINEPQTWKNLKEGLFRLLYERAFSSIVDRVWVVSEQDRWAMRYLAGYDNVTLVPNGVDADHFSPRDKERIPFSCAFWGRLDFPPNIQSLSWFVENVWTLVRKRRSDAVLIVCGYAPSAEVIDLTREPSLRLYSNLTDLRDTVSSASVAVMPMQSGAGIKNKLLEAAAMGLPIICSERACMGLRSGRLPFSVVNSPQEWVSTLFGYWGNETRMRNAGVENRKWVINNHSWAAAADDALEGLN